MTSLEQTLKCSYHWFCVSCWTCLPERPKQKWVLKYCYPHHCMWGNGTIDKVPYYLLGKQCIRKILSSFPYSPKAIFVPNRWSGFWGPGGLLFIYHWGGKPSILKNGVFLWRNCFLTYNSILFWIFSVFVAHKTHWKHELQCKIKVGKYLGIIFHPEPSNLWTKGKKYT